MPARVKIFLLFFFFFSFRIIHCFYIIQMYRVAISLSGTMNAKNWLMRVSMSLLRKINRVSYRISSTNYVLHKLNRFSSKVSKNTYNKRERYLEKKSTPFNITPVMILVSALISNFMNLNEKFKRLGINILERA